jgi:hypothetical protein
MISEAQLFSKCAKVGRFVIWMMLELMWERRPKQATLCSQVLEHLTLTAFWNPEQQLWNCYSLLFVYKLGTGNEINILFSEIKKAQKWSIYTEANGCLDRQRYIPQIQDHLWRNEKQIQAGLKHILGFQVHKIRESWQMYKCSDSNSNKNLV